LQPASRSGAAGSRVRIGEYKKRHHESNSRKKDGWMKDFRKNVSKAFRAGRKRAKVSFGFY
jgi:hypothetical protein